MRCCSPAWCSGWSQAPHCAPAWGQSHPQGSPALVPELGCGRGLWPADTSTHLSTGVCCFSPIKHFRESGFVSPARAPQPVLLSWCWNTAQYIILSCFFTHLGVRHIPAVMLRDVLPGCSAGSNPCAKAGSQSSCAQGGCCPTGSLLLPRPGAPKSTGWDWTEPTCPVVSARCLADLLLSQDPQ